MLHLPGPHLCPVCNVVHDPSGRDAALPRAARLRPYTATYIPLPTTAQTTTSTGVDPGATAAATISLNAPSPSVPAYVTYSAGAPTKLTIAKTGVYEVVAIGSNGGEGTSADNCHFILKKNGASVCDVNTPGGAGSTNYRATLPAGSLTVADYFEIGVTSSAAGGSTFTGISLSITFIPSEAVPS